MHRCANAATRTAPPARQHARQRQPPAPPRTRSDPSVLRGPPGRCRCRPVADHTTVGRTWTYWAIARLDLPACRELAGRPRSVPFGRDARQISAGAATRLVTEDHASTRVYLRLKGPRRPPPPKAVRLRALRGRPRSMPTRDPSHPHHHGHPHSSTVLMHVPAPSLSSIAHVFPLVLAPDSAPCRAPY